jgi:hypothetical protein
VAKAGDPGDKLFFIIEVSAAPNLLNLYTVAAQGSISKVFDGEDLQPKPRCQILNPRQGSVSKALDGKVVEELKERQSVGKCEFLDIIQVPLFSHSSLQRQFLFNSSLGTWPRMRAHTPYASSSEFSQDGLPDSRCFPPSACVAGLEHQ